MALAFFDRCDMYRHDLICALRRNDTEDRKPLNSRGIRSIAKIGGRILEPLRWTPQDFDPNRRVLWR